jgi:cell division protein FtsI (penicillin-binding protein 3)
VEVKKDILWRVYLVYIFLCLFGIAILAQVFRLQFVQGEYWKNKAETLTTAFKNIEAERGSIYAADGSLLATSVPIYEIRMDLLAGSITSEVFNKNVDSLSLCLANLFQDHSAKEYRRDLYEGRRDKERYFLIHRNVSYPQLLEMRKFPIFRMGKYKGGLIVIQKSVREKPFQLLASRTIGYDLKDLKPVGLEGSFRDYLQGVSGKRLMQKISGNVWMPINRENEIEPKDGNDLVTTLEVNIQDVAEHALLTQLQKHNAHHGCAVLMEVQTGEIKAIANLGRDVDGQYKELYNYAIGESTEPGSTFKLASLIAAIDDGFVDLDDTVNTENGTKRYYDRIMRDAHEVGGKISVQKAFELSSNVGISKVIYKNYSGNPTAFVNKIKGMNITQPIGLQIDGEGAPQFKTPASKAWSGTTLPWMSIGYEIKMTPMQILTYYNAVANNGRMVKPLFVKEIKRRGELIKRFETTVVKDSICSLSTALKARILLEGVVENGTAMNLKNPNYKIAGKTGTAQIAQGSGGYKDSARVSYQASFVGYFPADNPKFSCIVVVNAPSNDVYYAAQVAGPIFKEIADKVYSTRLEIHKGLQIEYTDPSDAMPLFSSAYQRDIKSIYSKLGFTYQPKEKVEWVIPTKTDSLVKMNQKKIIQGIVPNVVGMGVKDAMYILENAGMTVRISGSGKVQKQSLQVGSRILKGSEIKLLLG